MEYWRNSIADLGMRIVDFKLSACFVTYSFQSEIRNPKSEITLAPLLQQIPASRKNPQNHIGGQLKSRSSDP